jgi:hypothetical protein
MNLDRAAFIAAENSAGGPLDNEDRSPVILRDVGPASGNRILGGQNKFLENQLSKVVANNQKKVGFARASSEPPHPISSGRHPN